MAHRPIPAPITPRLPRLWPNLTAETQRQVAQLLATLLRRSQPDRPAPVEEAPKGPKLENLIEKATKHGFKRADIVTASRVYHNQPNITRLTPAQLADLDRRMSARIEKVQRAG